MPSPYTDPQEAIRNSPRYIVQHWRNIPQVEEDSLESFLSWLEENIDNNLADDEEIERHNNIVQSVRSLIDEYLGRDEYNKIQQSERALLEAWTLATRG